MRYLAYSCLILTPQTTINAKFLVDQNLAKFCFQKGGEIDADEMLNLINEMDIAQISSKLSKQIDNGGARKIVDEILKDI